MSDTTLPERWAKLLEQSGISGQQGLARAAGVSSATVNRMIHGVGRPSADTVRAVAEVLTGGDTDKVWLLIGTGHFDYGDFPVGRIEDDLRLLTPSQRKSLIAMVKAMADPQGKAGTGHVAQPDQKTDDDAGVVEFPRAARKRTGGRSERDPNGDSSM